MSRSAFIEIKRNDFNEIENKFKDHIINYEDEVKLFIENEMNKIDYFQGLTMLTKQEIIFSMERKTFDKDSYVCQQGEKVVNMILIQEGIVEIAMKIISEVSDNEVFTIERLGRGSIINHRSFLPKVEDDSDTDFKCRTAVSAFILRTSAVEKILAKK